MPNGIIPGAVASTSGNSPSENKVLESLITRLEIAISTQSAQTHRYAQSVWRFAQVGPDSPPDAVVSEEGGVQSAIQKLELLAHALEANNYTFEQINISFESLI